MPSTSYKKILDNFLSYIDNTSYTIHTNYSNERLLQISPEDICRYFNYKAYDVQEPNDFDRPLKCRANTLLFYKKAISYFMVRRNMIWDPIRKEGNPTRSDGINKLINKVLLHEVRGEGVRSKAKRPIEYEEFISILTIVKTDKNLNNELLTQLD